MLSSRLIPLISTPFHFFVFARRLVEYYRPSLILMPGRVAQSLARLTQGPEVPGSIPVRPHTFVSSI